MRATIFLRLDEVYPDGSRLQAVVWQLPEMTEERPHGFKYRLNYTSKTGETLVRYDNETGKCDHKHIGDKELPYEFRSIEQLFDDFLADVEDVGDQK